jgi:hypothetical protein
MASFHLISEVVWNTYVILNKGDGVFPPAFPHNRMGDMAHRALSVGQVLVDHLDRINSSQSTLPSYTPDARMRS